MSYQIGLLVLSGIGALNGAFLSAYFLVKSLKKKLAHFFLGMFLASITVRIMKPLIFQSDPGHSVVNAYINSALFTSILIGPLLFLFIYYLDEKKSDRRLLLIHLFTNGVFISILMLAIPYEANKELWNTTIVYVLYVQRLAYMSAAIFYTSRSFGFIRPKSKQTRTESRWATSIILGKFLILTAYAVTFGGIGSFIQVSIIFIFFLYVVMLLAFGKHPLITRNRRAKYQDKAIDEAYSSKLINHAKSILIEEELYLNSSLKVQDLAHRLDITPHLLSQILNEHLQKNFKQFINEYRIARAKKIMETNSRYTLEAIGFESGFRSRSNFYSTFKKYTGCTPRQYQMKV